jgi:hypothetical protein
MRAAVLFAILMVVPIAMGQSKTPAWKNGSQEKICGLGTYQDGLDLAFKNAMSGEGEILALVQVLPSLQREYAIALIRVGSEVRLFRATMQTQLWTLLGPMEVPKTREECLNMASAARVGVVAVAAAPNITKELWTAFNKIDLETDSCPRRGKTCALFLDGTDYMVETPDGRSVRIAEIGKVKGVRSENPALLAWIRTLLPTADKDRNYPW